MTLAVLENQKKLRRLNMEESDRAIFSVYCALPSFMKHSIVTVYSRNTRRQLFQTLITWILNQIPRNPERLTTSQISS